MGWHALLQGIFLTQGYEPVYPALADGFFTTESLESPFTGYYHSKQKGKHTKKGD